MRVFGAAAGRFGESGAAQKHADQVRVQGAASIRAQVSGAVGVFSRWRGRR